MLQASSPPAHGATQPQRWRTWQRGISVTATAASMTAADALAAARAGHLTSDGSSRGLQSAPRVEVLEQVALVGLVPAHLLRRDRSQVQPLDQRRREQPLDQAEVGGDRG